MIGESMNRFEIWGFYVTHCRLKSKIFLPINHYSLPITHSDTKPVTICKETDNAAWRKQ